MGLKVTDVANIFIRAGVQACKNVVFLQQLYEQTFYMTGFI